ncbi:MAG: substrate-binding domain-containing protein [Actinomycetota bacterium]
MAVVALVIAVVGVVVDSVTGDPETAAAPTAVTATEDVEEERVPLAELTGEFNVAGSSTVFPIVQLQAERFKELAPGVAISVEGQGSGDGAQLFCTGEVPIANASRLFKQEEIDLCADNGIEFIEIRRAVDGITVITSPANDAVDCVSFNDLYALLSSEAQGFTAWSDANTLTSAWGGTEFPDGLELDIFGPGEESGTFDSFTEIVIESVADGDTGLDTAARDFVETIRPDYSSSGNDNVIVTGVESSSHSIGWIGYAFAAEAAEAGSAKLLRVSVEDGGTCVSPNEETIGAAAFPISRFLYTYVSASAAETDQAVSDFVDYMLSDEGLEAVSEVGYIDLPNADRTRANTIWRAGLTGSGQWTED